MKPHVALQLALVTALASALSGCLAYGGFNMSAQPSPDGRYRSWSYLSYRGLLEDNSKHISFGIVTSTPVKLADGTDYKLRQEVFKKGIYLRGAEIGSEWQWCGSDSVTVTFYDFGPKVGLHEGTNDKRRDLKTYKLRWEPTKEKFVEVQ